MLHLQAVFERKTNEFPASDCVIESIVELSEVEYEHFRSNLLRDADFIVKNKERMYMDENGTRHCVLALGENQPEGVLVESQGYDYARYSSLLPGARDFVTARLNELAEQLVREGTQNTSSGMWAISVGEIQDRYHVTVSLKNGVGTMLVKILGARPELAELELKEDGFDMVFHHDYCPNLDRNERLESESPTMQMNM